MRQSAIGGKAGFLEVCLLIYTNTLSLMHSVDGFGRLPTVHLFAERAVDAARRVHNVLELK